MGAPDGHAIDRRCGVDIIEQVTPLIFVIVLSQGVEYNMPYPFIEQALFYFQSRLWTYLQHIIADSVQIVVCKIPLCTRPKG